jgi:hypothetical protein
MDAGPDAFRPPEPLGALPVGDRDLGPISPELALVDPDLARRARQLLPEPRERPRAHRPLPEAPALEPPAEPEVRRRRRWPRALALAIAIFAAGAVSGSLLGNQQTSSPGTKLEVRAATPTARQPTARQPSATRAALRPPAATSTRTTSSLPASRRQRRRHAQAVWASNVLGVEATVSRDGVALVWQRPAGSARVVVLRKRGTRSSVVVYRGRGTSYRDASPRPCTGYRYTIVNYDRRGHRSTGVPTSVVTRCA